MLQKLVMPESEGDATVKTGYIFQIANRLLDILEAHKCSAITLLAIAKIVDAKIRR